VYISRASKDVDVKMKMCLGHCKFEYGDGQGQALTISGCLWPRPTGAAMMLEACVVEMRQVQVPQEKRRAQKER
jgi:hypothetical protein